MRVRLLTIGHRQPEWVREGVGTFIKRLPAHWHFEMRELDPGHGQRATAKRQAETLLAQIEKSDWLVALDERGKTYRSPAFADAFAKWTDHERIVFAIGGADGFADTVRERANALLSLSALTLPHGLARVVLLEQLYRAHTLAIGHPYHRE